MTTPVSGGGTTMRAVRRIAEGRVELVEFDTYSNGIQKQVFDVVR